MVCASAQRRFGRETKDVTDDCSGRHRVCGRHAALLTTAGGPKGAVAVRAAVATDAARSRSAAAARSAGTSATTSGAARASTVPACSGAAATVSCRASTTAGVRGAGATATVADQAHFVGRLETRDRGAENIDIVAARLHPARLDRVQGRWIVHVGQAIHEARREGGADQLLTFAAGVEVAALRGWKGVGVLSREIAAAHASSAPGTTVAAFSTPGAPATGGTSCCPPASVIRAQD